VGAYLATKYFGLTREYTQALAIDMTARNMQDAVKKKGLPWSAVKGFDTFTPIGYVLGVLVNDAGMFAEFSCVALILVSDHSSLEHPFRTRTI
jgi:hypothetical protein